MVVFVYRPLTSFLASIILLWLFLCKANATVATLTTEVQQLRISAEESAARLQEATEAARLAEEQRAELQMKLQKAL
jgi:hypothetical protein